MSIRGVVILAAVLCAIPLAVSAAQQDASAPSAPSAPSAAPAAQAAPAQVSPPVTPLPVPGPALSPQFDRSLPAPSLAASGGSHTIVISTLALVLGIIIIVLLVARLIRPPASGGSPMRSTTRHLALGLLLAGGLVLGVNSCATHAQTGAVVGGAGGAVVGGVIGHAAGNTAVGAILGAAVGGIAGGIIGDRMDKQADELKQNIPGATVQRVGEGITVTFASGLLFDFDSDAIKSTAGSNLSALASSLHKYPDTDLLIVGHTDQVGSSAYNQGLSERRATAASSYLMAQGVAASRVHTRGMGEADPIATNDTELGRAQNRRVEVAIYASAAYRAQVSGQ